MSESARSVFNRNREKVYAILSQVLSIDPNIITEQTGPDNVASWDSFNALMLIFEFETGFDVKFTLEEVADVKCVADIIGVLKQKGIAFDDE